MSEPILHITSRAAWRRTEREGSYRADSLRTQGFIHASHPDQVVAVANALFRGRRDLVILVIDPDRVRAEICYEGACGELYPHVYGPLNLDAVTAVLDFPPDAKGYFALPAVLTRKKFMATEKRRRERS